MTGARRLAAAVLVTGGLLGLRVGPAWADGAFVACDAQGCDAGAMTDHAVGGGGAQAAPIVCQSNPITVSPELVIRDFAGNEIIPDGLGQWVEVVCSRAGQVVSTEIRYIHTADPAALRDLARSRLEFPALAVHTSPASQAYVNDDTWLWVDPQQWRPVSATASVPGVSVTVTATPVGVVWDMGDGSKPIPCDGPGKPYASGEAPPCGYVYRTSSAEQPGEAYQVSAKVLWSVAWSVQGAPGGGALDQASTTSGPFPLGVAEIQTERPTGG